MVPLIPLGAMLEGQSGRIQQVLGQTELTHRLHELGLCQGAVVEMVQAGSPCIVRLVGHKLCLRADDSLCVLVNVGESV